MRRARSPVDGDPSAWNTLTLALPAGSTPLFQLGVDRLVNRRLYERAGSCHPQTVAFQVSRERVVARGRVGEGDVAIGPDQVRRVLREAGELRVRAPGKGVQR